MAIINNLTNSSLRKYLPSKVISGYAQNITSMESWLYDDGTGDPWWQGAMGAPVRWLLEADVFTSTHSSHLTRSPNQYTGLDISPGMWVFSSSEPRAVRIVSVVSKSDGFIQCVVEDVDRYNTFSDPSGTGSGIFASANNLIFFELGEDGLPILNPLPPNTDISIVSQIEARFRVFNPTIENRFFQINHGFKEGQVLKINPDTELFEQATGNDLYLAGTVVAVGPGPHYFYLSPSTKIIKNLAPGLPGRAGDVIWIDPITNDRATEPNGSSSPLYIKMTDAVASFTVGSVDYPSTYTGTAIRINNELVSFDLEGSIDLDTMISIINAGTDKHGVVANYGSPTNKIIGLAMYPTTTSELVEFKLNNVLISVSTPSISFGTSGQLGWWDVIRSINEQSQVHNVYATFDANTGLVSLENSFGGYINFENITPLVTDGDNKTITDMLGVPDSNPPSTPSRLLLVRPDGGSIIISDVSGSFTYDTGVQSADNGSLPLALVVDKSMSATGSYIVADIQARDTLTNIRSGDQVFVQNGPTQGEWELFVRTGNTWTKISDYNSSNTDANSLSAEIDKDSTSPVSLGNISDGTRVVNVTVVVTEIFNGAGASLSVGTLTQPDVVITDANIDLSVLGSYESGTSFMYSGVEDGEIFAHLATQGSTTGKAKIIVSYL